MAEPTRYLALGVAAVLLAGCQVYGGAGTARLSGGTLETSSASASVGTAGVSTQSGRTVRQIRPQD